MKYRNIEIGIPTIAMVEEFCKRANLAVPALEVYDHYKKMDWKTKKGQPIISVEGMCNAANSVYIMRARRNGFLPQKDEAIANKTPSGKDTLKAIKTYLDNNADNFIATMEQLKIIDPSLWAILYNAASLHADGNLCK